MTSFSFSTDLENVGPASDDAAGKATDVPTRRPNLWIVSELYFPEETSTGYYITRIAEGLTSKFDVKVICGQPNYSARGIKAAKREMHKGVDIFRVAGTTLDKNVVIFRLLNMLTLGMSVLIAALRRFRAGDRVLVVTNPPTMPFIAALASMFRGSVYSLLIHDNYPEILVAAGKTKESSAFVRWMAYFNRWLYKNASRIIVVGRDMRELVKRKSEGLDVPIVTIPNWAELETVSPGPREANALLRELNIEKRFVSLYAGNMGPPNDVETIIEAAARLESDGGFHFIFLGAGLKRSWIVREVERLALSNVTVLDPKPRSEQSVFLNACDVSLVSLVDKMWGVSMPSRTYNILAAGKPIVGLTEPDSELELIVDEEQVGWTVRPNDPEALVAVLREARLSAQRIIEMGKRARRAAETKYSLETAMAAYRQAID